MPVEIRELVIRAQLEAEPARANSSPSRGPAPPDGGVGRVDEQRIVEACVREVMRILDQKRER
jgi:hypothetical protein